MKRRDIFLWNGCLLTAVALCARSVGLFFTASVTRAVGSEAIGLYTLMMTVFSFALTLATAGISLTVTRLVATAIGEGTGSISDVVRASLLYALLLGTLATVGLFFLAPWLAERVLGDPLMHGPLRLLSLSLLPEALGAVISGYFVGVRRVVGNAAVQISAQGAKMLLTLSLIGTVAHGSAVEVCRFLATTSLLADGLAFLIQGVRFALHHARCRDGVGRPMLREVCGMALPLGTSAYIRSALLTVEHALIPICLCMRGLTEAQALASYGILHAMTLPILLFPMAPLSSFSSLLVPEYAESLAARDTERLRRMTGRVMHLTLTYAVGIAVFLILFAEEIGYCFYGSYEVGYYVARMAPVLPLMYLDHVTDAMLKGIGEQVYSMWVNISDACLSVLLVRLLIPRMGIGGYALVIVCMEGYNFLLSYARLRRRIPVSLTPVRSVLLPLLASGAAALLCRHLFSMDGAATSVGWLIRKIVFCLCLFLPACYAFSRLPRRADIAHLHKKKS